MIKKIDHIVITTSDIERCLSFYELLGFTSKHVGERYELHAKDFKINVHILGLELLPHAAHVQKGSADLCFEVDHKIALWKAYLESKGLEIEIGIVDRIGVNGKMESIYLRDPDGNLIEFCSYE